MEEVRVMTFLEYLTNYVCRLSSQETTDVKLLAQEAQTNNHRLKEPLFLYSLFSHQTDNLLAHVKDASMKQEYKSLLKVYDAQSMECALKIKDKNLHERYTRVWQSYVCKNNAPKREVRVLNGMRDKVNGLLTEHKVPKAAFVCQFKLNAPKVTSWLNGQSSVSLDVAKDVLNCAENMVCM